MDLEEVANMSSNSSSNFTDEDELYPYEPDFYERLFLELFSAVALTSMIANILITFVILRFKKLRQDVTNIIVAHLNIMQGVYLLTTPLTLRVGMMFRFVSDVHLAMICVFYENEFVLGIAICFFIVLLVCDWYLSHYWESKYAKFCHVSKFFIGAIYIFVAFGCVITTQYCVRGVLSMVTPLALFVGFLTLLVSLIVINVVHLVRRKRLRENKQNIGLVIANAFFLLWCPAMIDTVLVNVIRYQHLPIEFILCFCLGFTSPVFNLFYLSYYVDSYNVFFKKVFKCQCNDYKNELLDEQPVTYNDVNGVAI